MTDIHFITHATSVDNEAGIVSGHRDCELSPRGRAEAAGLTDRFSGVTFHCVYSSKLRRAVETAQIAFGERCQLRCDARLDEIDYGDYTGRSVPDVDAVRVLYVDLPFPNGESYRKRVELVGAFLAALRSEAAGHTVLIVGHRATKWSLDVLLDGRGLADVVGRPFQWRAVWHYRLEPARCP